MGGAASREIPYRIVPEIRADVQVVRMYLLPDEGVPRETHAETRQMINVTEGTAVVEIEGEWKLMSPCDTSVTVEPGQWHAVYNPSDEPLAMHFLYDPPEHRWGLIQMKPDENSGKEDWKKAIDFFEANSRR